MGDDTTIPEVSKLTKLKDYSDNCLVRVSDNVYKSVKATELIFRSLSEQSIFKVNNIKQLILREAKLQTTAFTLPKCHDLKDKILNRFINVRLNIYCAKLRDKRKADTQKTNSGGDLGSKSMAMRKMVKNMKK